MVGLTDGWPSGNGCTNSLSLACVPGGPCAGLEVCSREESCGLSTGGQLGAGRGAELTVGVRARTELVRAVANTDTARLSEHSCRDAWSVVDAQTAYAVGRQVCYKERSPGVSRIACKDCPVYRSHRVDFGIRGLGFSALGVRKNRWERLNF